MPLTVRERIMEYYETRFKNVRKGVEDATFEWGLVTRLPVDLREQRGVEHLLGLFDSKESKTQQMGYDLCKLRVVCEFFFQPMIGDMPERYINNMLGEVQRTFLADPYAGGLILKATEVGSELDLESVVSKVAAGVVTFDVTYRHKVNDPFKLIGE